VVTVLAGLEDTLGQRLDTAASCACRCEAYVTSSQYALQLIGNVDKEGNSQDERVIQVYFSIFSIFFCWILGWGGMFTMFRIITF